MTSRRRVAVALLGLFLGVAVTGQARKVQVGYCSKLKNIEAAKAAGFDYLELGTSEIAALSDDEFEKAVTHIKEVGLPVPVTNLFLPATLKVTGPQIEPRPTDGVRDEGVRAVVPARHRDRRVRERRRPSGARTDSPRRRPSSSWSSSGSASRRKPVPRASPWPSSRFVARKPTSSTRRRRGWSWSRPSPIPTFN